jgi:hypothetical protein
MTTGPLLKRIEWQWDKPSCVLWARAVLDDGRSYAVGIPLAHVVRTFEAHCAEVGLYAGPYVGDIDSVDGLFSSVKRLAKKATSKVRKVVKRTQRTLAKGIAATGKVVTSKYVRYAGIGLAAAFPAVGAPALAALAAANAAYGTYRAGDKALSAARSAGKHTLATARAVARGQNVRKSVRNLAARAGSSRNARMALAALKSVK